MKSFEKIIGYEKEKMELIRLCDSMKNKQNNQKNKNMTKNCGEKNCGEKNCGEKHEYKHGGNND
jgi:hypothetical protein